MSRLLLLSGAPGVGKTTLLRRVAAASEGARGFTTEEIREQGRRVGFRIVPLDGPGGIMAHVDFPGPRVGRYGVDVAAVDAVAKAALTPGADLYLVDEIGKMECFSERFVAGMRTLLDAEPQVVATIARKGGGFIPEVRRRPDATLWEVTVPDREALVARVLAWISR
ncbi:MAG: nucleoside-triphosphatase [Planctomycetota bacterium]|jgi:nucleoside-triphosphatase